MPIPRRNPGDAIAGDFPMIDAIHSEVILLVEDDDLVRSVVKRMLERIGYRILEARNGHEGLLRLHAAADSIDLLLTDVCMPVLGGRELAAGALKVRPGLKIMFMSGQFQEFTHDDLGSEVAFLQKPFGAIHLAIKIRQTLDSQHRCASTA
jgi:CheY-like chemotaxis protein